MPTLWTKFSSSCQSGCSSVVQLAGLLVGQAEAGDDGGVLFLQRDRPLERLEPLAARSVVRSGEQRVGGSVDRRDDDDHGLVRLRAGHQRGHVADAGRGADRGAAKFHHQHGRLSETRTRPATVARRRRARMMLHCFIAPQGPLRGAAPPECPIVPASARGCQAVPAPDACAARAGRPQARKSLDNTPGAWYSIDISTLGVRVLILDRSRALMRRLRGSGRAGTG